MGRSLMVKYSLLLLQNWESEAVLRSFTCFYPNNSQFRPLTNEGASLSQTEVEHILAQVVISFVIQSRKSTESTSKPTSSYWILANLIWCTIWCIFKKSVYPLKLPSAAVFVKWKHYNLRNLIQILPPRREHAPQYYQSPPPLMLLLELLYFFQE